MSEKASQSLADPKEYSNLFPGFEQSLEDEQAAAAGGSTQRKVSEKTIDCGGRT